MQSITNTNATVADLDTSLLREFVTVADRGSMTATANALGLTQGAVSQKSARLEIQAGGKLLARERQGLKLTPAGESLLGKARRMLAVNDEILAEMKTGMVAGNVRLGLPAGGHCSHRSCGGSSKCFRRSN